MDGSHFDALTRMFGAGRSRRRFAALLGGLALGELFARRDLRVVDAKRKKGKKKRCKRRCGSRNCGRVCGRSCGSCSGGTCTKGVCVCPADAPDLCRGRCREVCNAAVGLVRNPDTCACCTQSGVPCQADSNCCSGLCESGECESPPGLACAFPEQCHPNQDCLDGACTCFPFQNSCEDNIPANACDGGFCFPNSSLVTRCARRIEGEDCGGCTTDAECKERNGSRSYCAINILGACDCETGEGFCVELVVI